MRWLLVLLRVPPGRPQIPSASPCAELGPLLPAVALSRAAATPVVVVADSYQNVVGYTFSPATGFQETFRKHLTNDARGVLMSSPVVLRDGHSVLSAWTRRDGVADQRGFCSPDRIRSTCPKWCCRRLTTVIPTLTADGRIVTLAHTGVTAAQTYPRVEVALIAPMRSQRQAGAGGGLAEPRLRLDRERVRSPWTRTPCRSWRASTGKAAAARRPRSAPTGGSMRSPARRCTSSRRRRRCLTGCPGDVTVPGGNVVFHPQNPFSNQGASPVFQGTPAFSGGGLSQPGAAPR